MNDWNTPFEAASSGDSGGFPPGHWIQVWNDLQAEGQVDRVGELVHVDALAFLAEIAGRAIAIARNKDNDPLARGKGLEVALKAVQMQLDVGNGA